MTVDSRTLLDRGSFRRLVKPLLDHDPSLTLKTTRWWVAHARKHAAWLQEALARLPSDQKDELRALVAVEKCGKPQLACDTRDSPRKAPSSRMAADDISEVTR